MGEKITDLEEIILPNYSGITKKHDVFFMVSGGQDSTAMLLEAYTLGIRGTIVFGETGFNLGSARETIKKLIEYTKFPLMTVRYQGHLKPIQVLKESFFKIPQARIREERNKNDSIKRMFVCCDILKKNPMKNFVRSLDTQRSVQVLGIKGSDGALHRRYWMRVLGKRGTFLRKDKKSGLLYYYPLRDCRPRDIKAVLKEHGFQDTKSSGCCPCPMFCVAKNWQKKDPRSFEKSNSYARRLGIEPHPLYEGRVECTGIK